MGKRGAIGTLGKRTKGVAVSVDASSFPPPKYLTKEAKDYWRKTVEAFPVGHFTNSDLVLLEHYCEAAAQHRRYMIQDPAAPEAHRCRSDVAMLATKLRITKTSMITPKSAGRAAVDADAATRIKNSFDGLLFNESAAEVWQ